MNILLAYATNSSGTLTASEVVEKTLTDAGNRVTRKEIEELPFTELSQYDLVIFASPSWLVDGKEGMPHDFFVKFMKDNQGKTTPGQKYAIFGLGDTSYEYFCGAVDHLAEYVKQLGGTVVGELLRIDGFYYDQQNNEKKLREWAQQIVTVAA